MARRNKGFGNFNKVFCNMRRGMGNCKGFGWFTPIRGCVCGAIFLTLLISGVSFYGIIIVGLLLTIMQLVD